MTIFGEAHRSTLPFRRGTRLTAAFSCDECEALSLGSAVLEEGQVVSAPTFEAWLARQALDWLPLVGVGRDFPDVPEHIAEAASEAYECQSINAYRGAVLLARSVVEATAKEKGHTSGQLYAKIEALHAAGLVREHIRHAAHEVRHLGNDMAHGDFVEPVSREEAEEVLQLMTEVLDEVFQSPARVERRKATRLAKQETGR